MFLIFMIIAILAWLAIALIVWAIVFFWHLILGAALIYVGVWLILWSLANLDAPWQ